MSENTNKTSELTSEKINIGDILIFEDITNEGRMVLVTSITKEDSVRCTFVFDNQSKFNKGDFVYYNYTYILNKIKNSYVGNIGNRIIRL